MINGTDFDTRATTQFMIRALNVFCLQNFELSQNIAKLLTMLEAVLYN